MYADKLESFLKRLRLTEEEYISLKEHCEEVLNLYSEEVQEYALQRLLSRKVHAIIPFLRIVCQNRAEQENKFLAYPEDIREEAEACLKAELQKGVITDGLAWLLWKCQLLQKTSSAKSGQQEIASYDLSAHESDTAFMERWQWVNSPSSLPAVLQTIEDGRRLKWPNPEQQELLQRRAEERYANYKNPGK